MLARIELMRLIKEQGLQDVILLIMTVHDSLVLDVPEKYIDLAARLITKAIDFVPSMVYNRWHHRFSLPLTCEISVGRSKAELQEYKM